MRKLMWLLAILLTVACSSPVLGTEPVQTSSAIESSEHANTPPAATSEEEVPLFLEVREGDQLVRDLLPRLMEAFKRSREDVERALTSVRASEIISPALTDFRRMEGMFVPGLYPITSAMTLETFLEEQITLNEQRVKLWSDNVPRNLRTPTEAVILASIVEAECLNNSYYQETADVFNNRLDQGQPLQSCVTVEYALGLQRFFLYAKDTEVQSPYNTYRIEALPVGPIAAFDDTALKAALTVQQDRTIQYFYYDYFSHEMHFFSDYRQFKKEANASMQRFIEQDGRDPRTPINKQELYR